MKKDKYEEVDALLFHNTKEAFISRYREGKADIFTPRGYKRAQKIHGDQEGLECILIKETPDNTLRVKLIYKEDKEIDLTAKNESYRVYRHKVA